MFVCYCKYHTSGDSPVHHSYAICWSMPGPCCRRTTLLSVLDNVGNILLTTGTDSNVPTSPFKVAGIHCTYRLVRGKIADTVIQDANHRRLYQDDGWYPIGCAFVWSSKGSKNSPTPHTMLAAIQSNNTQECMCSMRCFWKNDIMNKRQLESEPALAYTACLYANADTLYKQILSSINKQHM